MLLTHKLRRIFATVSRWSLLLSLTLLVFGLMAIKIPGNYTQGSSKQEGFAAPFTIADFDGDQKPDVAIVNVDRSDSRAANYSIHLRLSIGPEVVIGITGPLGGLQIVSRDVNGDHSMDLVVRTSLESNLVAVLLNDGHGKFTLADAGAFSALEKDSDLYVVATARKFLERISLLPPRNMRGEEAAGATGTRLLVAFERVPWQRKSQYHSFLAQSNSGRAPPSHFSVS